MPRSTIFRLAAIALTIAIIAAALWLVPTKLRVISILEWVQTTGLAGMVVLGALYIPGSLLFLPAWPLTLGAGFAFGIVRGTVVVSIGSVLGASAAFLAGRTLARSLIEHRLSRYARFAAIDRAVAEHGFKIVFLTRLSPVLPFNLLNYAFGLTKVSFRDYVVASWIGMLPGTILYIYLGSLANSLAALAAGELPDSPVRTILFVIGLVATLIVTIFVARVAKRALDQSVAESQATDAGSQKTAAQ